MVTPVTLAGLRDSSVPEWRKSCPSNLATRGGWRPWPSLPRRWPRRPPLAHRHRQQPSGPAASTRVRRAWPEGIRRRRRPQRLAERAASGRQAYLLKLTTSSTSAAFARAGGHGTKAKAAARNQLDRVQAAQDRASPRCRPEPGALPHPQRAGRLRRDHRRRDIAALQPLPGVKAVYPVAPKTPRNANAVPLQGAPRSGRRRRRRPARADRSASSTPASTTPTPTSAAPARSSDYDRRRSEAEPRRPRLCSAPTAQGRRRLRLRRRRLQRRPDRPGLQPDPAARRQPAGLQRPRLARRRHRRRPRRERRRRDLHRRLQHRDAVRRPADRPRHGARRPTSTRSASSAARAAPTSSPRRSTWPSTPTATATRPTTST